MHVAIDWCVYFVAPSCCCRELPLRNLAATNEFFDENAIRNSKWKSFRRMDESERFDCQVRPNDDQMKFMCTRNNIPSHSRSMSLHAKLLFSLFAGIMKMRLRNRSDGVSTQIRCYWKCIPYTRENTRIPLPHPRSEHMHISTCVRAAKVCSFQMGTTYARAWTTFM